MDEATPATGRSRRKWINFAIAPRRQGRIALVTLAVTLLIFITFFGFELWMLADIVRSLSRIQTVDEATARTVENAIHWSWVAFALLSAVLILSTSIAVIVTSHRVYGPLVAIRRHLEALVDRNYAHRTNLRQGDDAQDIAKLLNELSGKLEAGD